MSSMEHRNGNLVESDKVPEARYAYYRRCQVFRKGGEQCKAPAEKGSHICYAHAGQRAMAFRRDLERQIVLAEAVAEMRKRGKPECEMADLLMDFDGIQVTLAVMARAVISGRIDCKTAGRLLVQLQTVSKLLRMIHRKGREGRKEEQILPQIGADERRLEKKPSLTTEARTHPPHQARTGLPPQHAKTARGGDPGGEEQNNLPLINTDNTDLRKKRRSENVWATNEREETRIVLVNEVVAIAERPGWAHAPPELSRAA